MMRFRHDRGLAGSRAIGTFSAIFALLFAGIAVAQEAATEFQPPFIAADLDIEQCRAFAGTKDVGSPTSEALASLLGLADMNDAAVWSTGPHGAELRYFRIAFKRPISLGTLCTNMPAADYLREAAAYPGDVTRDDQWTPISGGGPVRPLAAVTKIRALRLTVKVHNLPWDTQPRAVNCEPLLLLAGRYWSPDTLGGSMRARFVVPVKKGQTAPAWEQWVGYWPEASQIAGLVLLYPTAAGVTCSYFPDDVATHPRLAKNEAWKPLSASIPKARVGVAAWSEPTSCQAIRLVGSLPPAGKLEGRPFVAALVPLGPTEQPPKSFLPPAPFQVELNLPQAGFTAVNIRDEHGKHIRRLIAEVPRTQGKIAEAWDLTDDDGRTAPPGKYGFYGLVRRPLKLTHEITVYNPGSPPWNAPVPGGGGWMADHSPPVSCCFAGGRMFFGSLGAEFGYGMIATDLEGKKVWSEHRGASRLVSDGRCAYIVADGEVIRIDPEHKFAQKPIHKFQYSEQIPGHAPGYITADHSGAAARQGLLCVSYRSPPGAWVHSSLQAGDIDLKRITPPVYPKKVHETALNPAEEVFSTFQTMTSSTAAHFGDAPKQGPLADTLVLPFNKEITVGSVLIPEGATEVWALRPGRKLPKAFQPPDPTLDPLAAAPKKVDPLGDDLLGEFQSRFDKEDWMRLPTTMSDRPDLALPKEGTVTRAVVFTGKGLKRLDYGLFLDRRYRNASLTAKTTFNEGAATKNGGWKFNRPASRPISFADPVTATLVWDQAVSLRGCAVLRPMKWGGFAIDVWTGDEAPTGDESLWREVHRHRQIRNHIKFSWHTDRVVAADFGGAVSTRAVRLRYIEPPQGAGYQAGPTVEGGYEGLITLEPLGGDIVGGVDLAQRISVLELPAATGDVAKLVGHLPLAGAGALAFDAKGDLYAACDQGIVRIRQVENAVKNVSAPSKPEVVIAAEAMGRPRALAFHPDGSLYVLDGAKKVIRVFDVASGKQTKVIGEGANPLGKWNPDRFIEPTAMTFDSAGKMWVVEQQFQPKRISRWSTDGQFEMELLGPTHYGGGGMMDPRDRTVVNHLGMKFRIDYEKRTWRLESRLAAYGGGYFLPDRTAYVDQHRYLIGDRSVVTPFGDEGPTSLICREENGVAVPIVAAGVLGDWRELSRHAELKTKAASVNALKTAFLWTDANSDLKIQVEEVHLFTPREVTRAPFIGDDLSLNFAMQGGAFRLRRKSIADDGTPRYDPAAIEPMPELDREPMVTGKGETFVMGHKLLGSDGAKLWSYPDRYMGVQASYQTPWGFYDRPPGVVAGSFGTIGHFEIGGETLFCVGGNNGDYYAFTRDGLLAAAILGGPRGYGQRFFSTPDYEPGKTDLTDLRKTVEDFHGHVTRAEDGNVYAIAGKNHATVIRVEGLDTMQRFEGTCTVSRDDIDRTHTWTQEIGRVRGFLSREGPRVYRVAAMPNKPTIDGDIFDDWSGVEAITFRETRGLDGNVNGHWKSQLGFDSEYLYVTASAVDQSPLVNRGEDHKTLFQQGDTFDLHLGVDPSADPTRTEAGPGDLRLVFAAVGNEPVCMLYRYRKSDGEATEPTVFRSPVSEITIDEVRSLDEAKVAFKRSPRNWSIEASIPWSALGVKGPSKTMSLRGDVGATESDPQGVATISRFYWANRSQVILSDLPSEARVHPALWGEFQFEPSDLVDGLLNP